MSVVEPVAPPVAPRLSLHIVTLFPSMFASWLCHGVVSRALERDVAAVHLTDLRAFGVGRHRVADDCPFGGGAGMVMKPEPIFAAVESLSLEPTTPVVLMSPRGDRFDQRVAEQFAACSELVLLAGHYEGVDDRVRQHLVSAELSVGDYVLSNGELAAMVVADAVIRLLPGAIASESTVEESFSAGLLEYPQYTRPATFRGWTVPEVLLSGNHASIAQWRRDQSLHATWLRRPELVQLQDLTGRERELIRCWSQERDQPA